MIPHALLPYREGFTGWPVTPLRHQPEKEPAAGAVSGAP